MTLITIDSAKGLFQQTGNGLSASFQKDAQLLASGDEIDTSKGFVINVTSAGNLLQGAGDNVTLKAGSAIGQLILLVNQGNFSIEFAHGHLANALAGNAAPTVPTKSATMFVWNGSAWSPTSQTLS